MFSAITRDKLIQLKIYRQFKTLTNHYKDILQKPNNLNKKVFELHYEASYDKTTLESLNKSDP